MLEDRKGASSERFSWDRMYQKLSLKEVDVLVIAGRL